MDPRATDRARAAVDPDAATSLALWLRAGRAQRQLSLDDIARITKIQPRILEKLESGHFEGLPAEVFVRGFVRSFARCVGLNETEALERFGAISSTTPVAQVARALVDTMSELAPMTAAMTSVTLVNKPATPAPVVEISPVVEVAPVVEAVSVPAVEVEPVVATTAIDAEAAEPTKKKRTRKKPGTTTPRPRSKKSKPDLVAEAVAAVEASPELVVEAPAQVEIVVASPRAPAIEVVEISATTDSTPLPVDDLALAEGSAPIATFEEPTRVWQPTMPPIAATPSVPWRRPSFGTTTTTTSAYATPTLVIDDSDPELAELERDEREAAKGPHRVSFLPPILLDREDKSARQGGLTLAVIILLIAATLTLSYLMRRPSVSGAGVTMAETPSTLVA